MFVPSDGIYQAALAEDPALIEYGVSQQVLMATPTTLIGLLRAVHYGWSQEQIAESAREIAESARELHRRLGPFAEHLAKTGRQLDSAVNAYNRAVGSFDHKLVPQIRNIERAGVVASERPIDAPAAIETTARPITARLEPVLEESPLEQISSAPPHARPRPAQVAPAPDLPSEAQSQSESASDPPGTPSTRAA